MLGLGIGYFAWYTPYSALAKALSAGLLPGVGKPFGGFVLLPATALGMFIGMLVFLTASRWWRYARTGQVGRWTVPVPGRETAASAIWMALIVATTTLNFTFAGFSILFMLVMMRIETLVLAPTMDLVRRRKISVYSWTALGLSMLSALVALSDVNGYRVSAGAFASLGIYLLAYTGRFDLMSRHAKTGETGDRRYFVEEHMSTPVVLVLLLAVPALVDRGPVMHALHEGFTTFLTQPAAGYGFLIGLCYEGLFIFTTLIFLDRREYAFCMPVHVCASLLAGIAASLMLRRVFGTPPPSVAQVVAAVCVVLAAFTLSWPAIRARRWSLRPPRRRLLFVCGGNLARSPMAEAIARAELTALPGRAGSRWEVASAGLSVPTSQALMASEAAAALRRLGVVAQRRPPRALTPDMCRGCEAVYCMTDAQRAAVVALVPQVGARIFRLDPAGDIPDPAGGTVDSFTRCAERIRQVVRSRLWEQVVAGGAARPRLVAANEGGA
jgi:protein-tyrosine-phosphatase